MIYEEQKALRIIQQFGLNEQTNATWRKRGKIPDKYFRDDYQKREKVSGERDKQTMRDIKRILGYGKLNFASIRRLLGIKKTRMNDILYNDITATKDEIRAIKKVITTIRIEALSILKEFNDGKPDLLENKMKNFIQRDEIKVFKVFGNKKTATKLTDWERGVRKYPEENDNEYIQDLMVFTTELAML